MPPRPLTAADVAAYRRDGFVVLRQWWGDAEVEAMRSALDDPAVAAKGMQKGDAAGNVTKLTLWWHLGDDTFSRVGRAASSVGSARALLSHGEPYHSHSKLLLKEPRTGGAWEWHQDFGYWYHQGIPYPEGIATMFVAIDPNTEENGCLRLVRGSHRVGRIEHGEYAGQACADPARVGAVLRDPEFAVVPLELRPGDVAWMHSCTIHSSAPNRSARARRNLAIAYNTRGNQPLVVKGNVGQPMYNAIDVLPDAAVAGGGVRRLADHHDAADFLGDEASQASTRTVGGDGAAPPPARL